MIRILPKFINNQLIIFLIGLLVFIIAPPFSWATNYYVSTSGSDSNIGTSTNTAWRTIQKAINTVAAGDTVNVMNGDYTGDFTINKFGTAAQPITFTGMGQTRLLTNLTQADASVWIRADYVIFKNFDVAGNIHIRGKYNRVENNSVHDGHYQSGISLSADSRDSADTAYNVIKDNVISYPVGAGIYIRGHFNQIIGNDISRVQDHAPGETEFSDDADGIRFFGHGHYVAGNYVHDIWQTDALGLPHIDILQTWREAYDIVFDSNIFYNPNPAGSNRIVMLERQEGTGPVSNITWINNVFIFADDSSSFLNFNRKSGQPEITDLVVVNNTFIYDHKGANRSSDKAVSFSDITRPVFRNNLLIDATDGSGDYVELTGSALADYSVGNNAVYSTYGLNPGNYAYPNDLWRIDPLVIDDDISDGSVDLRLTSNSPLIDAVYGATYTNHDHTGVARPQGVRQDIGAYEYISSSHCLPLGNIDCTGTVGGHDVRAIIQKYGTTDVLTDLNNSGTINTLDIIIALLNFGR